MQNAFVKAKDRNFELDQTPFTVSGVNCYFLAYCSQPSCEGALAAAKSMGATVVRSWAFLAVDPYTQGQVAFQYCANGVIQVNEGPNGLERLDALIQAAEAADIRLILPLVDYWTTDLGGMQKYVACLQPGKDVTEFYRNTAIRTAYNQWLTAILTRRNTLTGRLYSEEPAIMAWELTNEARCGIAGGRELLLDWANEISSFVKQRDSNHLLALGDEGFFYKQGSGHMYNGSYGVDWNALLGIDSMDFGSFHFYPQKWNYGLDLSSARRWIQDHATAGAAANKPVMLEEYGVQQGTPDRERIYAAWQQMAQDSGVAGSLVWMLGYRAPDTSGYVDDYVIYGAA